MLSIQLNNTVLHHRCHSPIGIVARPQLLVVRFPTMSRNICSPKRVRRSLCPVEPPIQWDLGVPAFGDASDHALPPTAVSSLAAAL